MTSTEPSVEPPSTMMYSRFGYPWSITERIVASINSRWLYDAVTMVKDGQAPVSSEARLGLASVHGQPVRSLGPDGSSLSGWSIAYHAGRTERDFSPGQ